MATSPPSTNHNTREYIGWVDLLRLAACFLVVLAHSCDAFVWNFSNSHSDYVAGTVIGSLVRPCVPLFAMISGILLLPVNTDIRTFYSKRLKRIIIPLIIWSLALPLLYFLYFNQTGIQSPNPCLPEGTYTWTATVNKLLTFPINFNYDTTPLWYLYMLIGVYLILPILSPWLNQASRKDLKLFLKIWGISLFIPAIQFAAPLLGISGYDTSAGILGVCGWNSFGTFYYFSGFLGYIIFAYYLKRFPLEWSWTKTLAICIPLFCIGYAITLAWFMNIQKHFPGDGPKLEISWWFCGFNVFLMTAAVYIIFTKIKITPSPFLKKAAALTLGIFLCHFVVVQACYDFLVSTLNLSWNAFFLIPLIALLSFSLSLLICWLLSLTPWTRKSVM